MLIKELAFSILLLCEIAFCKDSMPHFLVEPQSTIVRTGSAIVLRCSVDPDSSSVRWLVNGSSISSQKRRGFDLRDGSNLRIVSFNQPESISHEGTYQCIATNSIGSIVSREATLEAAVLNSYAASRTIKDVTALEGNVAVIPCPLPDSKPKAVTEFTINGTKVLPSGRFVVLPSGSLQIARVSTSDQGHFQCSAVNTVIGTSVVYPVSYRLRVIVPKSEVSPMFTANPVESVTVSQGSNLTLECAAEGWPVPQVTWEKYGGHLPVDRFSQVLGNLVINRIQKFDAGTYLCRVNKSAAQSLDKVINVDVLVPPSIDTVPEDQMATEGSTVVFKCRPSGSPKQGSPKPSIQWLYNGELLISEQFVTVRDTTLTLSNIRRRQAGIYQCVVRNSLGMTHAAARLTVSDSPHAQPKVPPSVQPTSGGDPSDVYDEYEEGDEEEEDYDLYDDSENGNWNFDSQGQFTEGDRPGPSKPKVSVLSNTSVLLNWQMAAAASGEPSIEMFKIKVKEVVEESSSKWITLDDNVSYGLRIFEVSGLRAGKTYRFRVVVIYADNERKVGPVSSKVTLSSGSSGSSAAATGKTKMPAPVIVEAHSVSKNKIYIGWQQPDTEQWPVEKFFIYFNPYNKDANVRKIKMPGTSLRNYVLSDLNPGTAYSIRMRSFGKSGEKSSFSTTVVKETLSNDGEPVDNFLGVRQASTRRPDKDSNPNQPEGQELTRDVSDPYADRQMTYVIIGIVLGVSVIVVVSGAFVCVWKRQRKQPYGDGEQKHIEQTTAFLSSMPDAPNGLINISDYAYKVDNGHLPHCNGECSLGRPQTDNGFCVGKDARGVGCATKSSTQPRKMAPDLVLPPPPSMPPPHHPYRAGNPEMSIYDTVDEDHGKASPAYAKVSSLDSGSTGAFPSQEVFGNLSRPTSENIPPKPLDSHAYWVLEQSRNQSLPERVANRMDPPPQQPQQGPYRQNMSVSQPCNRTARLGLERDDSGRRSEEDQDHYEHMISPSAAGYHEANQPNCCEPLSWPSTNGRPPNADRFVPPEPSMNGRRPAPKSGDPASFPSAHESNQDSWKALTSQVSNGQYRIQSGPGTTGSLAPTFALPRVNDYPSSDQEDCR